MPHYICHFTCNATAWPTERESEMAVWKNIVGEADNLVEGGAVKSSGWISNSEGYALLEASSKAEVIRLCAKFWPYFSNDIREIVPITEAGPAILAGATEGWENR